MLKITPLTNIKQNIIQKSAQRVIQKAEDTVAISTPVIKRITNKKEAEELVYLFIDSINDTFANKSEIPLLKGFTTVSGGFAPDVRALAVFALLSILHFAYKKKTQKAPSPIGMILLSAVLGAVLWSI